MTKFMEALRIADQAMEPINSIMARLNDAVAPARKAKEIIKSCRDYVEKYKRPVEICFRHIESTRELLNTNALRRNVYEA